MLRKTLIITLCCLSGFASTLYLNATIQDNISAYARNPHVTDEVWNTMSPYFLPTDMPVKAALDKLFKKKRILSTVRTMREAEFLIIRSSHNFIVARHGKLQGYMIKAFLDKSPEEDWIWWERRILGARAVQNSIEMHGYQGIMKTPKKWVYPLPAHPGPTEGTVRKNFILVVEDVEPLNNKRNHTAFKEKFTPVLLEALYTVLDENRLFDSIYLHNIPFCRDGKIAFLDTEFALDNARSVNFLFITHYLSKDMQPVWEQIVANK